MDSDAVTQLIFIIILIILSAFFSSAETALTTVNKIRVKNLVDEGNKKGKIVQKLTERPDKVLSAVLIGNNIVNLSASALNTVFATGIALSHGASENTGSIVGIATGILTIVNGFLYCSAPVADLCQAHLHYNDRLNAGNFYFK